jgi:hypothetical protein
MQPRLIEFPVHSDRRGALVVADYDDLPFEVKRAFWVFDFEGVRGEHALKTCHQLIIPMSKVIIVQTIYERPGDWKQFPLRGLNTGLYLPPMVWRKIRGERGASFFVLCSHPFDEDDYIDELEEFEALLIANELEKGLKFADEVPKY